VRLLNISISFIIDIHVHFVLLSRHFSNMGQSTYGINCRANFGASEAWRPIKEAALLSASAAKQAVNSKQPSPNPTMLMLITDGSYCIATGRTSLSFVYLSCCLNILFLEVFFLAIYMQCCPRQFLQTPTG
jgi:hypothetical protein